MRFVNYTLFHLMPMILLITALQAQPKVYFSTGVGRYDMADLRGIQKAAIGSIQLQPVSDFPAYFNYEGGAYIGISRNLHTAISLGYGSSGARSAYADYSGSVTLDQRVHYVSVGSSFGVSVTYPEKFTFSAEIKLGLLQTKLRIDESQSLNGVTNSVFENYSSTNGYLQPTLTLTKRFGRFGADVYLGYNVNYRFGKVKSEANDNAYLAGPTGGFAKIDWSGFRAGAGVSFFFRRKGDN